MMSNLFLTFGVIFAVIALAPVKGNDECGVSDFPDDHAGQRIINGTKVPQGKYPWLAYLSIGGRFCTGTIVSRKYILTAGHCVCVTDPEPETPQPCQPEDPRTITAVVGSVNMQKGQEFKVKKAIHHKKFVYPSPKDNGALHDIGLLELKEPLNFTENVRRVCLSSKRQEGDRKKNVVITGWGDINGRPTYPDVLREGRARIADDKICHENYGDYNNDMICMASRNHTMTFHGDSGGPALVKENGRWTKIGICSYGTGQVTFEIPSIYARVSYFCNWIAENTNNEVKCDS